LPEGTTRAATGQGSNHWPDKPTALREVAEAYIAAMEDLGKSVIAAIALALGVDPSLLSSRIDKAFWQLRFIYYPGSDSAAVGRAGIGQHTGKYNTR
jgi:isopenicillin N synthase-like dioxygenase